MPSPPEKLAGIQPDMKCLLELTTDSTRDVFACVSISEETSRVRDDLTDVEVVTSVNTVDKDSSLEWPSQAANRDTAVISNGTRVRERNARRTRAALGRLVNVRGGERRGLIFASDTRQSNVVADSVIRDVDAVLEQALCAGLAGGRDLGCVDDLVGGGFDDVFGVEVEELLILLPIIVFLLPLVVQVLLAVFDVGFLVVFVIAGLGGGSGDGESRAEEDEGCNEVHGGCVMDSNFWKEGLK